MRFSTLGFKLKLTARIKVFVSFLLFRPYYFLIISSFSFFFSALQSGGPAPKINFINHRHETKRAYIARSQNKLSFLSLHLAISSSGKTLPRYIMYRAFVARFALRACGDISFVAADFITNGGICRRIFRSLYFL